MIERVFADTGYWIAITNARDRLHLKALAAFHEYQYAQIITSEMVLTEFLNNFADSGTHLRSAAANVVKSLREASPINVISQSSDLFEKALRLYHDMGDKSWSLTDCSSFAIMKEAGLDAAHTHDRHFVQAGFLALLR